MPCNAAGKSPTADNTDVLPPTQSHMGKIFSQAFFFASFVQRAPHSGHRNRLALEWKARAFR